MVENGGLDRDISTHTLTWSVTFTQLLSSIMRDNFNSHAHVERDLKMIYHSFTEMISTHTLTWSVTQAFHSGLFALQFQLTRSRGA